MWNSALEFHMHIFSLSVMYVYRFEKIKQKL